MQYANDDARYEFPIRLCPAYCQVAARYGLQDIAAHRSLRSIDDVRDLLTTLDAYLCGVTGLRIGEGEESVDDLYRLCQRIKAQYRAAQLY